jgi:uncharacterized protein
MTKIIAMMTIGACLMAAGCSPLDPRPDHSQYFILTPIDPTSTAIVPAVAPATTPIALGVGPIDFPDYLRRLEVVTRPQPNEIDLAAEHRWAEPLDRNFTRVLTENLTELLNTQRIEKYPWPRRTSIDYQVVIDVQSFETTGAGQSQLKARWMIRDGTGKDLYASETSASSPVAKGDTGASVALSNDLATLSRDIATKIEELRQNSSHVQTSASR